MNRRNFIGAAGALTAVWRSLPSAATDLDTSALITLTEAAAAMAAGRLTARALTQMYLERIDALDRRGPELRAVLEVNPRALEIAADLDRERRAHGARGPLHGMPMLIKDNVETQDRMMTTAGSLALEGWYAPADAPLVARLRARGAVILGKTNLSEWANFRSTHSSSGWSGRGGQTRNPYALNRTPSGSSSGSAVAVAAGLCVAAVGSETDGSIVSPASINGIVGLKPTVGLVSRRGIVPISHSQDTAGPLTRSVRDAAILLGAMAEPDAKYPASAAARGRFESDYVRYLNVDGLRGARLGIARRFFADNAPLNAYLDRCASLLAQAGATLVDPADLPMYGEWVAPDLEVLLYEFKADLNAYLARMPPALPVHNLLGAHPLQLRAVGARARAVRSGAFAAGRREGGPQQRGVPQGARDLSQGDAYERHRCHARGTSARRDREPDLGTGVADRSGEWRHGYGRVLLACSHCGLPAYHGADGALPGAADRALLLRRCMERAHALAHRVGI